MSDAKTCKDTLVGYIKARIPFVSIRSSERFRVIEIIKEAVKQVNIPNLPVYVHTLSRGTQELATNRSANEDRSVLGSLDFATQQMSQRENVTFILTEVADIEDDDLTTRQILDNVMLASEKAGAFIVITAKPVWGALQRLGMSLVLDPPNEDEMLNIIRDSIAGYRDVMKIEWTKDDEKQAAAILAGISSIEAINVISTLLAKGAILKEDISELVHAKDRIFADISGIERVHLRSADFTVGGLAGLKTWLARERPLLTADLRERGIRPPRGVLLVGVPGCGKSLSAKAIAIDWNMPLYRLDLSTIHGQYLGQSEGRLKEALATADHVAPCILWIDEIEKGLAGATQGGNDGGTSTRLVGQFLFWLQESHARVFIIATANDVSKLPPELLRRGRFDELFFIDLPSAPERAEIIDIYVQRGLKAKLQPTLMDELVALSEGFAGADLEAAVREVAKEAFLKGEQSVTEDFFRKSFSNIVPFSKTNPEGVEAIKAWGRERAVPASGIPITGSTGATKSRRSVLVS
jgi:hypothetical protein